MGTAKGMTAGCSLFQLCAVALITRMLFDAKAAAKSLTACVCNYCPCAELELRKNSAHSFHWIHFLEYFLPSVPLAFFYKTHILASNVGEYLARISEMTFQSLSILKLWRLLVNCVNGSVLNESDPILQKYASHHAYQTAINLKQCVFAPKCSLGLFRILLGRMTEFIDCDIANRLNQHAHSWNFKYMFKRIKKLA
jgi:hypothetical protein